MTKERKVSEPKISKCGTFYVRNVKIGNSKLGEIHIPKIKAGERPAATFWTSNANVIRMSNGGKFLTVSQAFMAGLQSYAVTKVGLRCADGTTYKIDLDIAKPRNPGPLRVAFCDIPVSVWEAELPEEETRMETLMKKIKVSGRRAKSSVTSK